MSFVRPAGGDHEASESQASRTPHLENDGVMPVGAGDAERPGDPQSDAACCVSCRHRGWARSIRPPGACTPAPVGTGACPINLDVLMLLRQNVLCRRWRWPDKRAGAVDRSSRCRSRSSCGRSSLRIPVCNTKGMPSGAAWSSTRAGPPLGDTVACGNSDPSVLRSVLLIFFLALPNTTDQRAGQWHGRSGRSN